jgi:hypothetical protein
MANANVGQGKDVTTSITLTGEHADNYTLAQPSDVTVNITTTAGVVLSMADFTIEDLGNSEGRFYVEETTLTGAELLTIAVTCDITVGEWRWGMITLTGSNEITLYASQFGDNKGLVTISVSFIEDGKAWLGSIAIMIE